MRRGYAWSFDLEKVTDSITGVEVTRITDNLGDTLFPYFTQSLLSADGKNLLVTSDRTGSWQLCLADLEKGEIVQLTDEPGVSTHSPCLDGSAGVAYYWSERTLKAIDLESLESEALYAIPDGFRGGILSLSADGRYLYFVYAETAEMSTQTGRIYSSMREQFFRRPACVIMRVDTTTGDPYAVWGEHAWISHVSVSPVDENLVLFCHEGPTTLLQRMWVVRGDTTEVWPLVKSRGLLNSCVHEYFTRQGEVVTQLRTRESIQSEEWTQYNLVVNPDGSNERRYRFPSDRPGHIQSNSDNSLLVGDRAFAPGFEQPKDYMCLMQHKEDTVEVKPLCKHGTSWETQHCHPHPIFTLDDGHVLFNSDAGGHVNVYMAPAAW